MRLMVYIVLGWMTTTRGAIVTSVALVASFLFSWFMVESVIRVYRARRGKSDRGQ